MAYKTYNAFLAEQERTYDFVKLGNDGKGFDNHVFLQALNSSLAKTCSHTFITPYIALGSISRVLAYGRIIIPQVQILDKEKGTIVFDCHQFGDVHGKNLDGSVATSDNDFLGQPVNKYFVFFSYHMEPDGFYDCFCKIVDSLELVKLMDGQENVDDDNRLHEEPINEISKPLAKRYLNKASVEIDKHMNNLYDKHGKGWTTKGKGSADHRKLNNREKGFNRALDKASGNAKVNATEEQDDANSMHFPQYHKDLPSYTRKLAIEEPVNVTEVSKGLLKRYIKKAYKSHSDIHQKLQKLPNHPAHDAEAERLTDKATKRSDSIDLADRKIGPKTKVHATEEKKNITELSKHKLSQYIGRAIGKRDHKQVIKAADKVYPHAAGYREPLVHGTLKKVADNPHVEPKKSKADLKLVKDETALNELSASTLHRYRKAANLDSIKAYDKQRKSHNAAERKQLQSRIDHRARGIHIARAKSTMQRGARIQATANEEPLEGLNTSSGQQSSGKQVNEVSKGVLMRYINKAYDDRETHNRRMEPIDRAIKRTKGIKIAHSKLIGKAKVNAS